MASLVLKLCDGVLLEPGREYVFWFHVQNPGADQAAPELVMGAAVGSWCESHRKVVAKPSCTCGAVGTLLGVAAGGDVLRVVAPRFEQASVEHSSSVAGAINTLVLILRSTLELASPASLLIRGLALDSGSVFPSAPSVRIAVFAAHDGTPREGILCDADGGGNAATWDDSEGTLLLFLCPGAVLEAAEAYAVAFNITNPNASNCFQLLVETKGTVVIEATELHPPLIEKAIGQTMPFSGLNNSIMVTLMFSVELRGTDQSKLTLSGLYRAFFQAGDLALEVERETAGGAWEPEVLFCVAGGAPGSNVGVWSGASELELAFCQDKTLQASTKYRLRLPATNPPVSAGDSTSLGVGSVDGYSVSSPEVTIKASGTSEIAPTLLVKPETETLYGVPDGADPFELVSPEFTLFTMSQASPFTTASNLLTLVFSTTVETSRNVVSAFVVSGLSGATLLDGDAASLRIIVRDATSAALLGALFCDQQGKPDHASWVTEGASPALAFELCDQSGATVLADGTSVMIAFEVLNPSKGQASPDVCIEGGGSFHLPATCLSEGNPNNDLFGVPSGSEPLAVVEPVFTTRDIEQSSPFSGPMNAITITLSTSVDLIGGTVVTISGLEPLSILESKVPLLGNHSGRFCSDGQPAEAQWDGSLFLRVCDGQSLFGAETYTVIEEP